MPDAPLIPPGPPEDIDTSVPHSARFWNVWLGGKDHYPVDREVAEKIAKDHPGFVDVATMSRRFLCRAVRHLIGEAGIRQLLDIGTGLPTFENTHEVAQRVAPEARVVYVDNDPLVLAHARALLTSSPEGVTDYVDADLHDPDAILHGASKTLDLSRPVGLILMGIVGHVADYGEARAIIRRLLAGLPPGSYLAHYDATATSRAMLRAEDVYNRSGAVPYYVRSPEQIAAFYDGLAVLDPGVVRIDQWRPDERDKPERRDEPGKPGEAASPAVDAFGGVARKP